MTSFDNENAIVTSTLSVDITPDMTQIIGNFEEDQLIQMICHLGYWKKEGRLCLIGKSIQAISIIKMTLK